VEIHANVIDNILNDRFLKRGAKQALCDVILILLFGIPLGTWDGTGFSPLDVGSAWLCWRPLVAVDYAAFPARAGASISACPLSP